MSVSGSGVRGSIPGGVENFHLKIFNLGARRGGNVHFLIARFRSMYVENAYSTIDSDSSVGWERKACRPLGAFRDEQAMSRHRVSRSPFLSSSSHTTQLHYTKSYTYSHPNSTLSLTLYRYSSHTKCGLPKRCVIRKYTTLNAIYPPCVEPEARNSG